MSLLGIDADFNCWESPTGASSGTMSPRRSARVFLATFFSSFRATPFSYADPEFRFAPLWAEFYHAFGVSHGRQMPLSPTLTPTTDADAPQTDTDHQP
jgi:hypothetical protein